MFHAASKILFFIFQPSSLAVIAIGTGLILARATRGRGLGLIAIGFAWIVLAGFFPLGNALVLPLEERFGSREPSLPQGNVTGIILLGPRARERTRGGLLEV